MQSEQITFFPKRNLTHYTVIVLLSIPWFIVNNYHCYNVLNFIIVEWHGKDGQPHSDLNDVMKTRYSYDFAGIAFNQGSSSMRIILENVYYIHDDVIEIFHELKT